MAGLQWSDWMKVEDGEIPPELLPARAFQYRWWLDTEFEIPSAWGFSGGSMRISFELQIGEHFHSVDSVTMICVTQWGLMSTYYPGMVTMVGMQSYPMIWPDWDWQYDTGTGLGVRGRGYAQIRGWLWSPQYKVALPAGAEVDVQHWRPQTGLGGEYWLEIRTALAKRKRKMLLDPVTNDQNLPRLTSEMLVLRTQTPEGLSGVRDGMVPALTSGQVAVTPGHVMIDFMIYELVQAAQLAAPSGTSYLYAVPVVQASGGRWDVVEIVTYDAPQPGQPGCCLGRIKSGKLEAVNGVLLADDVDDYAIARQEDGVLIVRMDQGSNLDVELRSTDRGVTWR